MSHNNACGAVLALSLLIVSGVAARACEGDDCPAIAKAKPLNVMQFMREQAASTRAAHPNMARPARVHTAAKVRPAARHSVAASALPPTAPLATAAAASFASQPAPEPAMPRFGSSEFAAVDNAASAPIPGAETMGAAFASDPSVQVVAEAEFNDIDRKADETAAVPEAAPVAAAPVVVADAGPVATAPVTAAPAAQPAAQQPSAVVSWLQWLWAAVSGTFTALAAAVRQLTHV
jgi:hypothetical protein